MVDNSGPINEAYMHILGWARRMLEGSQVENPNISIPSLLIIDTDLFSAVVILEYLILSRAPYLHT